MSRNKNKKSLLKFRPVEDGHFSSGVNTEPKLTCTRCIVHIIEANDLLASDAETGRSDPVCFMKVCAISDKPNWDDPLDKGILLTEVKYKTIKPKWNKKFTFPIVVEGIDELFNAHLHILVRDEDIEENDSVSYDSLGELKIPLKDVIARGKKQSASNAIVDVPQWFRLTKAPGMRKVDGSVHLAVKIVFGEDDTASLREQLNVGTLSHLIDEVKKKASGNDPKKAKSVSGVSVTSKTTRKSMTTNTLASPVRLFDEKLRKLLKQPANAKISRQNETQDGFEDAPEHPDINLPLQEEDDFFPLHDECIPNQNIYEGGYTWHPIVYFTKITMCHWNGEDEVYIDFYLGDIFHYQTPVKNNEKESIEWSFSRNDNCFVQVNWETMLSKLVLKINDVESELVGEAEIDLIEPFRGEDGAIMEFFTNQSCEMYGTVYDMKNLQNEKPLGEVKVCYEIDFGEAGQESLPEYAATSRDNMKSDIRDTSKKPDTEGNNTYKATSRNDNTVDVRRVASDLPQDKDAAPLKSSLGTKPSRSNDVDAANPQVTGTSEKDGGNPQSIQSREDDKVDSNDMDGGIVQNKESPHEIMTPTEENKTVSTDAGGDLPLRIQSSKEDKSTHDNKSNDEPTKTSKVETSDHLENIARENAKDNIPNEANTVLAGDNSERDKGMPADFKPSEGDQGTPPETKLENEDGVTQDLRSNGNDAGIHRDTKSTPQESTHIEVGKTPSENIKYDESEEVTPPQKKAHNNDKLNFSDVDATSRDIKSPKERVISPDTANVDRNDGKRDNSGTVSEVQADSLRGDPPHDELSDGGGLFWDENDKIAGGKPLRSPSTMNEVASHHSIPPYSATNEQYDGSVHRSNLPASSTASVTSDSQTPSRPTIPKRSQPSVRPSTPTSMNTIHEIDEPRGKNLSNSLGDTTTEQRSRSLDNKRSAINRSSGLKQCSNDYKDSPSRGDMVSVGNSQSQANMGSVRSSTASERPLSRSKTSGSKGGSKRPGSSKSVSKSSEIEALKRQQKKILRERTSSGVTNKGQSGFFVEMGTPTGGDEGVPDDMSAATTALGGSDDEKEYYSGRKPVQGSAASTVRALKAQERKREGTGAGASVPRNKIHIDTSDSHIHRNGGNAGFPSGTYRSHPDMYSKDEDSYFSPSRRSPGYVNNDTVLSLLDSGTLSDISSMLERMRPDNIQYISSLARARLYDAISVLLCNGQSIDACLAYVHTLLLSSSEGYDMYNPNSNLIAELPPHTLKNIQRGLQQASYESSSRGVLATQLEDALLSCFVQ